MPKQKFYNCEKCGTAKTDHSSQRSKTCLKCRCELKNIRYFKCVKCHKPKPSRYDQRSKLCFKCKLKTPCRRAAWHTDHFGYIYLKIDNKTVKAHRLLMELYLGRDLLRSEDVHHKNGDKLDNSYENLQILSRSEHTRLHMLERNGLRALQ